MISKLNVELKNEKVFDSILTICEDLAKEYRLNQPIKNRKDKGQFFTPKKVSIFMADMLDLNQQTIKILDPGAGFGILTAAICRKMSSCQNKNVEIVLYENDPLILEGLEKVTILCKNALEELGHIIKINIIKSDFIIDEKLIDGDKTYYDIIISNPPYYKLSKSDIHSIKMNNFVFGQPNIYYFFMVLSTLKLKNSGQMVFITPRSFCSGLYFKKFRQWFLEKMSISKIHIFESRKKVFPDENILQETIILKSVKNEEKNSIEISSSIDSLFKKMYKIKASHDDVIHRRNGDIVIRIPTSEQDLQTLKIMDKWPTKLKDQGLTVSTGPVVPFRCKKYLISNLENSQKYVPLIWMNNFENSNIIWPIQNSKPQAIAFSEETSRLLVTNDNYVLIKRFSSKEQKHRLSTAVLLKSKYPFEMIGIENHVNYIHNNKNGLPLENMYGLSVYLNSSLTEKYFRILNGNTQVNANDLNMVPFPDINILKEIGKIALNKDGSMSPDEIVYPLLRKHCLITDQEVETK